MKPRCKAKRRDGARCTIAARDDGYCFAHSPALASKRAAAHKRGGRGRAYPELRPPDGAQLESAGDVLAGLRFVITATWRLDNSALRSRALIAGYLAALQALTAGEVEARLAALEQRFAEFIKRGV